jgi:uncharacterized RDD family membrane protein YckC
MKFAGFWIRVAAAIIDWIIIAFVFFILEKASGIPFLQAYNEDFRGEMVNLNLTVITYVISYLYFVSFVASKWQATPGKRLLKIYVVTEDAGKISLARSFGREAASYLAAIIMCIGYLMVAFTKQKTGLHDLIAHTRVIYGRPGQPEQQTV